MKKLFVIDAVGWVYRSYFALPSMVNGSGVSTNALFGFIRSLLKLIKDFQPDHVVAVFDGPNNTKSREAIYADYKATRKKAPEDLPHQIGLAQDFCDLMGIPMLVFPDVEADDTMASVVKIFEPEGTSIYLCTSDKDMAQMVSENVFLLNTHKDNLILDAEKVEEAYGVPPSKIVDWLAIAGDTSDNVPGLPGFGPKTASKLLAEFGSLDEILENPDKIPGKKKQETVRNDAESAKISRELVRLNMSVEVPEDVDFFVLKEPNREELKKFYLDMGFHSLVKEMEQNKSSERKAPEVAVDYQLVDDEQSLKSLLSELSKEKEVCFDTETTHVRPLLAELVGIGLGVREGQAWYVPLNGSVERKRTLELLKPFFEDSNIGLYGHNVKYDYHLLLNEGIRVADLSFDTILASYVLHTHSRQHSLDTLSLERFGKVKTPIQDLIGKGKKAITMAEVEVSKVCDYCCEDVDYTVRLRNLFEKELEQRGLYSVFHDIELPLVPVLADMERKGIFIDLHVLKESGSRVVRELKILEDQIYQMSDALFNINSPKQLGVVLFEKLGIKSPKKTATGSYSTGASVLETLRHEHPIVDKVLEYRGLEKLRSTYYEALPGEVNPKTGRIHCNFNQSVTSTGRLSSQDPNLQNIPVRTEQGRAIRQAFRPERKGWSFLAADYSQIELRLLAHLSGDPGLVSAFKDGEDIHKATAAEVFGVSIDQVTREQRYQSKAVNFGILYGQQAFGLSQELGIPRHDAAAFINRYFERYPRVREFIESCKEKARRTGKAVTITGRERAIPEIHSKNGMIRQAAERLAVNTPLQGTAADLIKMAMLKADAMLKKQNKLAFMILQIHDELLFEAPDFELIDLEHLVRDAMQKVMKLKVPLIVDVSIGKNWKEC